MNRDAVLFNLREAKAELDRTIGEIDRDESYDCGDFLVAMGHLYHHLNTAGMPPWRGIVTALRTILMRGGNFRKMLSYYSVATISSRGLTPAAPSARQK